MSVETAAADRLPWLPDEPTPASPAKRHNRHLLAWSLAAMLAVAGTGSWLGYRSVVSAPEPSTKSPAPAARVQLPTARPATPEVHLPAQREVGTATVPEVRPAPRREVKIVPPAARTRVVDKPEPVAKVEAPAPAQGIRPR